MFLDEAADLCRECHRLAPFCNFNGNTFAAIARSLMDSLKLQADKAQRFQSGVRRRVGGGYLRSTWMVSCTIRCKG
jgi:hypothetical protein